MDLDFIPLWALFGATILAILASVEAGFFLGRRAARRSADEKESPVAAMGGAVLGLVAFMLAFTFGIASGRLDTRKELVREEANAIRTAYLRAEFMPEAERAQVRQWLKEYLGLRIAFAQTGDLRQLPEVLAGSEKLQRQMWAAVVANGRRDNSDISALLVESINDLIDLHALRLAVAIETRIPTGIWAILFAISFLGMMAVGYQSGIAGSKRSQTILILAISFSLVITLIFALDRPNTSLIRVKQLPLLDVEKWIESPGDSAR